MQSDLPLLLFVQSRKTLNLQYITFPDFFKSEPLSLIFKANYGQTFFHSLMIQEYQLCAFPRVFIFLILPRTLIKRPLYFDKLISCAFLIFETKYGFLSE